MYVSVHPLATVLNTRVGLLRTVVCCASGRLAPGIQSRMWPWEFRRGRIGVTGREGCKRSTAITRSAPIRFIRAATEPLARDGHLLRRATRRASSARETVTRSDCSGAFSVMACPGSNVAVLASGRASDVVGPMRGTAALEGVSERGERSTGEGQGRGGRVGRGEGGGEGEGGTATELPGH